MSLSLTPLHYRLTGVSVGDSFQVQFFSARVSFGKQNAQFEGGGFASTGLLLRNLS